MTALQQALAAFFGGIGLPVYLAGWVPAGAPLPYLTLSMEEIGGARGRVTVRCWHRAAGGANAARAGVMDALARAVPRGGVRLTLPAGCAVLRRGAAGFQTLKDGPGAGGPVSGETVFDLDIYGSA